MSDYHWGYVVGLMMGWSITYCTMNALYWYRKSKESTEPEVS